MRISTICFVFEKNFSCVLENYIDSYIVMRFDEQFCTPSLSFTVALFTRCTRRNYLGSSKMQGLRLLYTISILSPHLYTAFRFVHNR
jgi:hypothetical protein